MMLCARKLQTWARNIRSIPGAKKRSRKHENAFSSSLSRSTTRRIGTTTVTNCLKGKEKWQKLKSLNFCVISESMRRKKGRKRMPRSLLVSALFSLAVSFAAFYLFWLLQEEKRHTKKDVCVQKRGLAAPLCAKGVFAFCNQQTI